MSKRSERITPSVANPTLPFKLPASWPYTAKIKYCRASGHKLQGCIQDMLRWQIPLLHGIAWVSSFCAGCRYHPSRIDFLHADSTRRCNMWRIYGNTVQQNKRQQKNGWTFKYIQINDLKSSLIENTRSRSPSIAFFFDTTDALPVVSCLRAFVFVFVLCHGSDRFGHMGSLSLSLFLTLSLSLFVFVSLSVSICLCLSLSARL